MSLVADKREQQLAEREQDIARARELLRSVREQISADRTEADRLLAEARNAQREANRNRNRTKRLARRFVRRLKNQQVAACRQLDEKVANLDSDLSGTLNARQTVIGIGPSGWRDVSFDD